MKISGHIPIRLTVVLGVSARDVFESIINLHCTLKINKIKKGPVVEPRPRRWTR